MKDVGIVFMTAILILGVLGIGAYLVMEGHPWFGLLVILVGACINVKSGGPDEDDE